MPAQEKSQQRIKRSEKNFQQVLGGQSFPGKSCCYLWRQRETSGAPAGSGVVWGMPANLHSAGLWSHVLLIDIKTVSHNLIRKIHVSSEMTTLVTLRVICLHPSCTKKQIQVLCLGWCPSKAMSCFLHITSSRLVPLPQQTFLEYINTSSLRSWIICATSIGCRHFFMLLIVTTALTKHKPRENQSGGIRREHWSVGSYLVLSTHCQTSRGVQSTRGTCHVGTVIPILEYPWYFAFFV